MSDKKNTEIAVNEGFAALANRDVLNEAMADDCQGLDFSFDRVKLPAGGGTAFEIPSAESDESEMAKDITGVIVYNHPAYAYYHDKYTGGNNPPDCGSFDGVTGIGTPGGNCASCPYNKFGSGEGQSKLCKNKRMLYILREGELFPITLSLPTGSLKSFTNYVKSQLPAAQAEPGGHEDHSEEGYQRIGHRILPGGILVRANADRRRAQRRGGCIRDGKGVCREPYSGGPH